MALDKTVTARIVSGLIIVIESNSIPVVRRAPLVARLPHCMNSRLRKFVSFLAPDKS
ncbi:hypothetical protein PQR53_23760 [Paraburkholderia fungorum]|uniref:hypothetical protein n=1 Tax=Paraburkholderia fungorum TaxID=134537 RepID=UPI0038BC7C1E